jgi:hypothetical protein
MGGTVMGKWWGARSWEQKLALMTLLVTVVGSVVIPIYLDQRDSGSRPVTPATTTAGALPASSGTTPPVTDSSSVVDTAAGEAAPLTPDGKVVRYLSDLERVEGEYPEFEVFLDGGIAAAKNVAFGRAVDLRVPVTGVLRLRLVTTPLNPESPTIYPAWADGRLLGDPAKVPPTT